MNRKKLASLFKQQAAIAMAIAAELEADDSLAIPARPRARRTVAAKKDAATVANDVPEPEIDALVEARAAQALRRHGIGL